MGMIDWSDVIALVGAGCLVAAIYLQVGVVGLLAALGALLIVLSMWMARREALQRWQAKHNKQQG